MCHGTAWINGLPCEGCVGVGTEDAYWEHQSGAAIAPSEHIEPGEDFEGC